MKNKLIALSVISSIAMLSSAFAKDGTINFTGNILDEACIVETESASQTVNLGNVSVNAFGAAGDTAAPTAFSINLKDCPASVTKAAVKFDGSRDAQNTNLLKLSATSTATGVGIGIYESDSTTSIPLQMASVQQSIDSANPVNTLNFVAKYVSTAGTVTAGSANGVTDFTIVYN